MNYFFIFACKVQRENAQIVDDLRLITGFVTRVTIQAFFLIGNYFFISYLHISYKHCFFYLFSLSAIQAAIFFTLRKM
jgi:ABC-type protease/lipase transport system fused ATPase/permease subunit